MQIEAPAFVYWMSLGWFVKINWKDSVLSLAEKQSLQNLYIISEIEDFWCFLVAKLIMAVA